MKCAGCHREMDVGDQFIQFTPTEYFERQGLSPLPEMDDLFADIMGSDNGEKIVYCEGCTQKAEDGWLLDTVYGDEDDDSAREVKARRAM